MKAGETPVAIWAWPLAVLGLAALVLLADPGGLASHLRNIAFDAYQYSRPRPYEDPRAKTGLSVRTLEVDQAAVAKYGPWPWSHTTLAKATDSLREAGATLVVLALPLDRGDGASPKAVLDLLPKDGTDAVRGAIAKLRGPDDLLAKAMASTHVVSGFTLRDEAGGRRPELKGRVVLQGNRQALEAVPQFRNAAGALEPLEIASSGSGALNLAPDADGKVRSLPFVFRLGSEPVQSLEAETLRLANAAQDIRLIARPSGFVPGTGAPKLAAAKTGVLDTPLSANGSVYIYYARPNATRGVSAAALLDGKLAPDALKNAIVFFAPPDATIDTPVGRRDVGEVRAEAMEGVLLGSVLIRPNALGAEILFTLLAGALIIYLLARRGLVWAGVASLVLVAGMQAFAWTMFVNNRLLIDALVPSLTFVSLFAAGALASAGEFTRTRGQLKYAFAEALPPSVLERIARRPALLKLDGETRAVTYLSLSVRDFAKLASSFLDDPHGFTKLMRRFMGPLLDEVTSHGGTVDRVTSDGFAAFWNAPLDDPEHAIHACEAANAMTEALAHVNDEIARERRIDGSAIDPIEVGIGISTGQAVAGGFGARQRAAYSVIGDPVVTADRIRVLSQQYGPAVVLSEETRKEASRGFAFLEVDYIAAGARDEPLKLYALLGSPVVRASPKFRAVATFHDHIFSAIRAQQWSKARELITQCRKLSGASQKLYDLHLNRIDYFEDNPPGTDWDGAFRTVVR